MRFLRNDIFKLPTSKFALTSHCQVVFGRWYRLQTFLWVLAWLALQPVISAAPKAAPAPVKQSNYFVANPLPTGIRRVAVLPLVRPEMVETADDVFQAIVDSSLLKTGKFEAQAVSATLARAWTGKAQWKAEEPLPPDLFTRLQRETGCDAVLFVQITGLKAYPPLAIGWRLRLVTVKEQVTVWAADEWFDTEEAKVVAPLKQPALQNLFSEDPNGKNWKKLNSPRLFAEFSLAQVLSTIPVLPANPAKVLPEIDDKKSKEVGANQPTPRLPAKE
jgi:hypothetical protein